ncbi:MAG: hypothetical protein N3A72_02695 [bacterium]|nr:hypothetical protein [bacterium]
MRTIQYHKYLIILGLTVISVIINGYQFKYADQDIYFAYLPLYTDTQAYPPSDLMMLGKQTGGNYYTYLWYLLLPLIHLFGLEWTCFIVHGINIYLIFLAIYFLAIRIGIERNIQTQVWGLSIPLLLVLILLLTKKFVAGVLMVTIEPYLHPRNIALVFLLFAIERSLADKWFSAFTLAGIAANIHLLSAFLIFFCLIVSMIYNVQKIPAGNYDAQNKGVKKRWIKQIVAIAGFVLCSSPIWLWILLTVSWSSSQRISTTQWLQILQYRTRYLFPQFWDRDSWLAFLSIIAMFSIGYYQWYQAKNSRVHSNVKNLLGFIVGILLLILIGIVFSEYIPFPLIIGLQLIRSIQFFIFIAIILIVPYILELWKQSRMGKLWAFAIGIGIFLFEPKTILLFLLSSIIYLQTLRWIPQKSKWIFGFFLILMISVSIPFIWKRVTAKLPQWFAYFQGHHSLRQTFLHYIEVPGMTTITAWEDVQRWAKEHSDKHSLWITPIYLSGFRVDSQRSTLVEWKDGALSVFNAGYAQEWYQRLQAFGITVQTPVALQPILYRNLAESQFSTIAEKYNAQFVVVEKPQKLSFPLVYTNTQFNVYQVSERVRATPRVAREN